MPRWHRRWAGRGRQPCMLWLAQLPPIDRFMPVPMKNAEPIIMEAGEAEAFRLVDFEGLSQEDAAQRMHTSRGTIWRLVQSARKKAAQAISEGRPLFVKK